ncbi:MAG TPA: hypothetical protein VI039_00680 [Solirubrobacterales bacterium]
MNGIRIREKGPILVSLALLVGVLVALQLSYSESGLLYLAPALLLLGALAFDHYPGKRLLATLARAWHPLAHFERAAAIWPLASPRVFPRGGVLLAMALAGRGPPS